MPLIKTFEIFSAPIQAPSETNNISISISTNTHLITFPFKADHLEINMQYIIDIYENPEYYLCTLTAVDYSAVIQTYKKQIKPG
jgi:hypothetical protein